MLTGASTTTITFAVSQLVGLAISHIWYVRVYVPSGVFGATSTFPLVSIVMFGVVNGVSIESVTSVCTTGVPFKISLVYILIRFC
ncbi:hypothetical protein FLGE108171_02740 [Flavobacterium gelidilacus]